MAFSKTILGIISAFFYSVVATAQLSPLDPPLQKHPHFSSRFTTHNALPSARSAKAQADLLALAKELGATLAAQYNERKILLSAPLPKCDTAVMAAYARAHYAFGQYQTVLNLVQQCEREQKVSVELWLAGADAATQKHQWSLAQQYFEQAAHVQKRGDPWFSVAVIRYAAFALFSSLDHLVEPILAREASWSKAEQKLILATLEYYGFGYSSIDSFANVRAYVQKQIGFTTPHQLFFSALAPRLLSTQNQHAEILKHLKLATPHLINYADWFGVAYSVIYSQGKGDFSAAQAFYNSFIPFTHPEAYLPLESNVYTYSEVYSQVCPKNLLPAAGQRELVAIKTDFRRAQISLAQALSRTITLIGQHNSSPKADALSWYANLLELNGDSTTAQQMYWQAHQACPFYNRSHWGLKQQQRQTLLASYPDAAIYNQELEEHWRKNVLPEQNIAAYIRNWSAVPEASRKAVAYSIRIFWPYLSDLVSARNSAYMKLPAELLSEIPGLEWMRDQRVVYDLDYRLWDDVRGVGGDTVVADIYQTETSHLGDYSLLTHEMAHQFHTWLGQHRDAKVRDCVERLFANAKQRNKFINSYSSTNSTEYFAEGVTYFVVPANRPRRFGTNAGHVQKVDPDLYNFIRTVEAAQGLKCSI